MSDEAKTVIDPRIVSGATCTWWGTIDETGLTVRAPVTGAVINGRRMFLAPPLKTSNINPELLGLPCCPHCGGVLFEVPSIEEWWAQVDAYEKSSGDKQYRKLIEFMRGRHFFSVEQARDAFINHEMLQPRTP